MSKILGAVEIGTHKAKAMVGVLSPTGDLKVVAASSVRNEGVRKGEIVDYRKTASAVHAAIEEAEKAAEAKIDEVYLAQTGSHLRGTQLRGSSSTAASDNRVEYSDIERASEEAKRKEPEEGRCFVHHVRSPIVLDDRIVEDPVGMSGSSIEIGYWAIEGDNNSIKETVDIIGGYGRLGISDLFVSSIASGAIVAGADLQQSGVLVVDIGAGVTD
jgi:cell division protein FtsA